MNTQNNIDEKCWRCNGLMADSRGLKKQQGVTLFTALMFLVLLSLLGVNAAQMSSLEERMAGNSRDRDIAFQAAEATLSYLSTYNNLDTLNTTISNTAATDGVAFPPANNTSGPALTSGKGLQYTNICMPNTADYWNGTGDKDCNGTTKAFAWSAATAQSLTKAAVTLNQIAAQPMYVVERYADVTCPSDNTLKERQFRITVRAQGGSANAVVILQALVSYCK
jgi:type IV pilus assembly protein PilX